MPLLPAKRLRELKKKLKDMEATKTLALRIENKDTGESVLIGGEWSTIEAKYVGKPRGEVKVARVHSKQWDVVKYVIDAVMNNNTLPYPIQDIIVHGSRRSGKSKALYIATAIILLTRPASQILVVSLRKKHGKRIMGDLKKIFSPDVWEYDRREDALTFINASKIWSKSQVGFDNDRGDSLDALLLDEAGFMDEDVYEALSPSVVDRNGVNILASSPHNLNWFSRKARMKDSPDESKAKSVRVVGISMFDNTFLSSSALRRAKLSSLTMSKTAYKQEILGEFINATGTALPDFTIDTHVINTKMQDMEDVTLELTKYAFNFPANFIVGVDFNFSPTAGTIVKFDANGAVYYLDGVITEGSTEKWGDVLYSKLKALGSIDPYSDAVIVADASGRWQGTGKNAPHKRATWKILNQQGWRVFPPSVGSKANPRREDRLEVARALALNMAGEIRLFVDKEFSELIDCFLELDLKNGLPNLRSKHIHLWDGATYPIFRIWGTKVGKAFFKSPLIEQQRKEKTK